MLGTTVLSDLQISTDLILIKIQQDRHYDSLHFAEEDTGCRKCVELIK